MCENNLVKHSRAYFENNSHNGFIAQLRNIPLISDRIFSVYFSFPALFICRDLGHSCPPIEVFGC